MTYSSQVATSAYELKYPQYQELSRSIVASPAGYLTIFASDDAVKAIDFTSTHPQENENQISSLAASQLKEYIAGARKEFDLPLDPEGTAFQKSVWQQLIQIKYGELASYLDIAKAIGNVKACRAVGAANGRNPIPIVIPCHRIIGSNGKLTGYAGGLERKSYLLALESKENSETFSLT
ncbi:methylated-DNA--[protein]-cysteine S-methyltransferase [Glaciecola sp. MH2013]|nr:methylated-DNA--[protein]-cysteine S-methyltransferase [Glaciecola sp. MH2013]